MAEMTNLLVLSGLVVGGYYLYSTGMLDSILGGMAGPPPSPPVFDQFEGEVEEEEEDDDKKDKKRRKRREDVYEQGPPPGYPSGPPVYQGPPPPPPSAPPPGAISSLYPMNVPSGPPYTSQTVRTYSQYSPYNQFSVYQEYRTPPRGTASTMPDDNVNFTDINSSGSYQCYQCYRMCKSNPYSIGCASCRMSCKKINHTFIPPAKGWTIAPVGQQPYYSGLGMISDTLLGRGATFAEMDDYSQKRRFDCHNKLKRRVKGKDNQFVTQEDYYYDRNNINLSIQ